MPRCQTRILLLICCAAAIPSFAFSNPEPIPPHIERSTARLRTFQELLDQISYKAEYIITRHSEMRAVDATNGILVPGEKIPAMLPETLPQPISTRGRLKVQRSSDKSMVTVEPTAADERDVAQRMGYATEGLYQTSGETARFYRPEKNRLIVGPANGQNAVWTAPQNLALLDYVFNYHLVADWYRVYGHFSARDAEAHARQYGIQRTWRRIDGEKEHEAERIEVHDELTVEHLLVDGLPLRVARDVIYARSEGWMPVAVRQFSGDSIVSEHILSWQRRSAESPLDWFPVSIKRLRFMSDSAGKPVLLDEQVLSIRLDTVELNAALTEEQMQAAVPSDAEVVTRSNPTTNRSLTAAAASPTSSDEVAAMIGDQRILLLVVLGVFIAIALIAIIGASRRSKPTT